MPSAKILEQKKAAVVELTEQIKNATAGVIVDYRGLTVEEDTKLRIKLREAGVYYKVVKNTLTRFAANEVGYTELDPVLNGPTALALSEDPVAPAKVLADFAKENPNLEIKAGFLDGNVISIEEINRLASTPSRDVLIAKIMGSLNAPISNLVRTLQALVDGGVEPADAAAGKAAEAPAEEVAAPEAAAPEQEAPAAEPEAAEAPAEEAPAEEPAEVPAEEAAQE
ncbi:MAG: 50S ribosomal protein L10 [Ruminococcaceae bacterium]|nr:50S ribosomal protein L10 [Oscillospiraceae bacterium]